MRDAPLRALTADHPPLLFVVGDRDAHVDLAALDDARAAAGADTEVFVVAGGDAHLVSKLATTKGLSCPLFLSLSTHSSEGLTLATLARVPRSNCLGLNASLTMSGSTVLCVSLR